MTTHIDIQKTVWSGTVPLVISLYRDDLTELMAPKPLHITVPRMILWSSVVTIVHAYFIKQTAQLEDQFLPYDNKFLLTSNPILEACVRELELAEVKSPVWLEGPGKTVIDWKLPVGVLVDLWTSTGVANASYLEHSSNLPIKITAHFSRRPEGLSDCNVVVCRGWSSTHRDTKGDETPTRASKKDGSDALIAKSMTNVTRRGLAEHNTKLLLPIFLQLPSSTHIQTSLAHMRMNSAILHNSTTSFMGLKTADQATFVTCLYCNNSAELSTVIPLCDCHNCSTFSATLSTYGVSSGSNISKAKRVFESGVQKVLSVLKRDDSDTEDDNSHSLPSIESQMDLLSSSSSTVTPGSTPKTPSLLSSQDERDGEKVKRLSIATSNMSTHSSAQQMMKNEMSKEQREQYESLVKPADMLLCQLTRLIILTKSIIGTLNDFEKSLSRLDYDSLDTYRRRMERSGGGDDQPNTPSSEASQSAQIQGDKDIEQRLHLWRNPHLVPMGWKQHYYNLPIKFYVTQTLQNLSHTKPTYVTVQDGVTGKLVRTPFEIKWVKSRYCPKLDLTHPEKIFAKYCPNLLENKDNNTLIDNDATYVPESSRPSSPLSASSGQCVPLTPKPVSPYEGQLTVEQFFKVIMPNYIYNYGKNQDINGQNTFINDIVNDPSGEATIVAVCHGIILPYDTPLIWVYNHMHNADLALHLIIALQKDFY